MAKDSPSGPAESRPKPGREKKRQRLEKMLDALAQKEAKRVRQLEEVREHRARIAAQIAALVVETTPLTVPGSANGQSAGPAAETAVPRRRKGGRGAAKAPPEA